VLNKMRGVLDVCAIKPPSFGERRHTPSPHPLSGPSGDLFPDDSSPGDRRKSYLEDIAIVTGATFVTEQLGLTLESASGRCWGEAAAPPTSDAPAHALAQVTEEMLGKAARVAVSKERTTMIATGSHAGEEAEEQSRRISAHLGSSRHQATTRTRLGSGSR